MSQSAEFLSTAQVLKLVPHLSYFLLQRLEAKGTFTVAHVSDRKKLFRRDEVEAYAERFKRDSHVTPPPPVKKPSRPERAKRRRASRS